MNWFQYLIKIDIDLISENIVYKSPPILLCNRFFHKMRLMVIFYCGGGMQING